MPLADPGKNTVFAGHPGRVGRSDPGNVSVPTQDEAYTVCDRAASDPDRADRAWHLAGR